MILWISTLLTFLFYLAGWRRRKQRVVEKHLQDHDQVFYALKKSEERYDKLINHMNEGLVFTDEKDKICFVNKCACTILKTNPERILGRPITDFLLSPANVRKLGLPYKKKQHGSSHREEIQMTRDNGEMFWAGLNISYLDTLHDHMPGSIIAMTDITEKKKTEEKLHNLIVNLSQRVKHLECLFDISDTGNIPGISMENVFEKSIKIIPHAFDHPSDIWVEIILGTRKFVSRNYSDTNYSYTAPIKGLKKKHGSLRVGYRENRSSDAADGFQLGEKVLVKNIAEKFAQIIEQKEIRKLLDEKVGSTRK